MMVDMADDTMMADSDWAALSASKHIYAPPHVLNSQCTAFISSSAYCFNMAPTSTLKLLSAVHSTTVLSGPFVTPSTISPAGTTVLTYDLWKGGLVCFAVAIVSVVGYFYRRRRKDAMSEPKQPGIALPIILPCNDSAFCSPYDTSLACDHSVLQLGRNQLERHVASPCNVEVICLLCCRHGSK
jgi:hypothetical protein